MNPAVVDAPYERQLFVCTYGAWCRLDGADEIRAALKAKTKEAGLDREIRITKSGCFGQCGHGPMMVAWPENVWYHKATLADVDELFESHVRRGEPVERLRYHPAKPGSNKTDEVKRREAEKGTHID
jgi:(2Fe-2S) ferredoxin